MVSVPKFVYPYYYRGGLERKTSPLLRITLEPSSLYPSGLKLASRLQQETPTGSGSSAKGTAVVCLPYIDVAQTVYKAFIDQKPVAVKVFYENAFEHFVHELDLLYSLFRSPYLVSYKLYLIVLTSYLQVQFEGAFTDPPMLVHEFMDQKSLQDLLRKGVVDPYKAWDISHDILMGLNFLHILGIIHRDIKPANILLCTHGVGFKAKIAGNFYLFTSYLYFIRFWLYQKP